MKTKITFPENPTHDQKFRIVVDGYYLVYSYDLRIDTWLLVVKTYL